MSIKIKNLKMKVTDFAWKNKLEFWLLICILSVGAFMRLYKIGSYMTFLGDEGRDAIVVRRLLVNFDPILIGPGTSIGNMYLGPLYYYLISPFLLIFNFSPVGPSVMVALFGVSTIFFIWYIVREWFSTKGINYGALIVSLLYAVSPTVIKFSRSSWNPNIMPFFATLVIYSIWKIFNKDGGRWWFVTLAVSFAFVLNSHYLGLLLLPVVGFFWFLRYLNVKNTKTKLVDFGKNTLWSALIVVFLMSPLFVFDARHGWNNANAIKTFFTVRQETVSIKPWNALPKIGSIFDDTISSLIGGKNRLAGKYLSTVLEVGAILYLFRLLGLSKLDKKEDKINLLLISWIGVSMIGLGLYKQHIYDHYYGFFFTAPFILLAGFINHVWPRAKRVGRVFILLVVGYLLVINLRNSPLKETPNNQMQRAIKVANLIEENSGGNKLNLAVIAENNYEDGYQYFLEKDRYPVYDIDPLDYNNTLAQQLFVVCELSKDKCDPVNSPKAGIANFGWSKVDAEWDIDGVTVYKLVHVN